MAESVSYRLYTLSPLPRFNLGGGASIVGTAESVVRESVSEE
jgi:hypothetical protein